MLYAKKCTMYHTTINCSINGQQYIILIDMPEYVTDKKNYNFACHLCTQLIHIVQSYYYQGKLKKNSDTCHIHHSQKYVN